MNDLRQIFQVGGTETAGGATEPATRTRQLARDRVFDAVRAAIVEGRIAPGTRLTERELCDAFGVSRTLVREIARRLDAEKLATVIPHQGLRVATLTRRRVREIYEIRTELEAMVVRNFLAAATDDDIATAQDYGAKLLDAGMRGDKVGMAETMSRFNHFMGEVAGNGIATEMLDQLNTRINILRVLAMAEPGQLETGMDGVRAIVAGIVARDVAAAEQAVRVYVHRSGEAALRRMELDE